VAKLSAHGCTVIDRFEGRGHKILLRSDGHILVKRGQGWSTHKAIKGLEAARPEWLRLCNILSRA
jgi:hypothetical protein